MNELINVEFCIRMMQSMVGSFWWGEGLLYNYFFGISINRNVAQLDFLLIISITEEELQFHQSFSGTMELLHRLTVITWGSLGAAGVELALS